MQRIDAGAQPLDRMCEEILARDHAQLRVLIRQSDDMLRGLSEAGTKAEAIRTAFDQMSDKIESHLSKEEYLLFPVIGALAAAERENQQQPASPFSTVLHPIRLLESEHALIESMLTELCDLLRQSPEPDTLAPEWRRFRSGLCHLEAALREHRRTENEVLFPRALDLERRLL